MIQRQRQNKVLIARLRQTLYILCLLALSIEVQAQNKLIDSLKIELKKSVKKDSNLVSLYNTFAYKHYGLDQEILKEYALKGKELAQDIGFHKGEARSWYLLGIYHLSKGELETTDTAIKKALYLYKKANFIYGESTCYDLLGTLNIFKENYNEAVRFYQKALNIARENGNHTNAANFLSNIGGSYSRKGDFQKAIAAYREAIALFDSLGLNEKSLTPLSNIALTYTRQGRHLEALDYFQKCLSGYREHGNKIFGSGILLNMGLVYMNLEEHDKALPYVLEALEINRELGNQMEISKNYIAMGNIYRSKGDNSQALNYFKKSLTISETLNSNEGKYNSYSNMAGLLFEEGKLDLALTNFKKSLELSLKLGGKRAMSESYIGLGSTYFELNDYRQSLENVNKGMVLANELSLLKTQLDGNLVLSKLYEKQGKHQKALEKFKLYKAQNDSLLNREKIKKITQLEYDYKYKQKLDSAQLRELQLTNEVHTTSQELEKSNRNLLLGIILFLFVGIVLGTIIFNLKLRNAKSKTQNIAIEQKLLRSQMTPHFIFNALSVLQGIILNKEEHKAVTYLSKFSKLLRIILENSREKTVSLDQELEAVEYYLALQNMEESQRFQYKMVVDERIDPQLYIIPPMLIQPFIENAMEHAFENSILEKVIEVQVSLVEKQLVCTITDNGIGIDAQKSVKKQGKKSFATAITTERLELMSKDFETKGSILIEDRKKFNQNGTKVTINIPYKTEKAP